MSNWTFFSNHAHVLFTLYQDPSLTLRDVGAIVGITERAVQRIVADLEEAKILGREKLGRKNHYIFHLGRPLRHDIESHRNISDLINLIGNDADTSLENC